MLARYLVGYSWQKLNEIHFKLVPSNAWHLLFMTRTSFEKRNEQLFLYCLIIGLVAVTVNFKPFLSWWNFPISRAFPTGVLLGNSGSNSLLLQSLWVTLLRALWAHWRLWLHITGIYCSIHCVLLYCTGPPGLSEFPLLLHFCTNRRNFFLLGNITIKFTNLVKLSINTVPGLTSALLDYNKR